MTTLPDLPPRSFPDLAKAEFAAIRAELTTLAARVEVCETETKRAADTCGFMHEFHGLQIEINEKHAAQMARFDNGVGALVQDVNRALESMAETIAALRNENEDLRVRVAALESIDALRAAADVGEGRLVEQRLAALEANVSLLQKALSLLRDGLKVNAEAIQAGFAEYAARLAALEAWKQEQEGDGR